MVRADRAAVLIDGQAYFTALREGLREARRSVFVIGWDMDSRMLLTPGCDDGWPAPLGMFLDALVGAHRHLEVHLLDWDFAMLYALDREVMPIYHLGWRTRPRLRFHLDGVHPVGASHHQKIVVIDDALAFVGGLDLAQRRWDTPGHLPDDPRRIDSSGAGYAPFHDVQLMVGGPVAAALGELARGRWERATGRRAAPPHPESASRSPWPGTVPPDFVDVDVAIARTQARCGDAPQIEEVRALHVDAIAAARHAIYLENQYVTSAAIGDALAARLAEPDGPEVVIVTRRQGGGWLEHHTMTALRAHLVARLRAADRHARLRVYHPHRDDLGETAIRLHSKVAIVDDRILRIGSANLNNRSMGYDTECDLAIEARTPEEHAAVRRIRDTLLAEHLGVTATDVTAQLARDGSLLAAVAELGRGARRLEPLDEATPPELDRLLPDSALFDPERPVDPDALADALVPAHGRRDAGRRLSAWAAALGVLALLAAAWHWTPLAQWADPAALAAAARDVRAHSLAPLAILCGFALAALAAVPVTVLILATALVFGPYSAFAYALGGSLAAAMLGFAIGRSLGRDTVRRLGGQRLNRLSRRLGRRGLLAVLTVRILPVAPFALINLAAGASHIRARDFLVGTSLGMLPGILAATVFADRALAALRDPSPATVAVLGAVTAALVGAGLGLRRWIAKRPAPARAPRPDPRTR